MTDGWSDDDLEEVMARHARARAIAYALVTLAYGETTPDCRMKDPADALINEIIDGGPAMIRQFVAAQGALIDSLLAMLGEAVGVDDPAQAWEVVVRAWAQGGET